MKKKLLSVIVPCYNEQESLPYFYKEIKKVEKKWTMLILNTFL